jgi:hypothetical protein
MADESKTEKRRIKREQTKYLKTCGQKSGILLSIKVASYARYVNII